MTKTRFPLLASVLAVAGMLASCGGSETVVEPDDAIDGYAISFSNRARVRLVNLDGSPVFAGKTILDQDGNSHDGSRLTLRVSAENSVGGFFRIDSGEKGADIYLLSKEPDKNGALVSYGPFFSAGFFYEDVAPVVAQGHSISYIRKDGTVAFCIDEAVGAPVARAYDFRGGLSPFLLSDVYAFGAVNAEGAVVLPPVYYRLDNIGSGLWLGENMERNAETERYKRILDVLNSNGEVLFSFNEHEWRLQDSEYGCYPFSGKYGIMFSKLDSDQWKIVNKKGETVMTRENIDAVGIDMPTGAHRNGIFEISSSASDGSVTYSLYDIKGDNAYHSWLYATEWIGDGGYYCGRPVLGNTDEQSQILKDGKVLVSFGARQNSLPVRGGHIVIEASPGFASFYDMEINHKATYVASSNFFFESNKQTELITGSHKEIKPLKEVPKRNGIPGMVFRTNDLITADAEFDVKTCKFYSYGTEKKRFTFDKNGNLTEYYGNKLNESNLTRDEYGRITRMEFPIEDMYGDSSSEVYAFEYNEKGWVSYEAYASDFTAYGITYTYDESGKQLSSVVEGDMGKGKRTYSNYVYDSRGNWVRRKVTELYEWEGAQEETYTESRSISYYSWF